MRISEMPESSEESREKSQRYIYMYIRTIYISYSNKIL